MVTYNDVDILKYTLPNFLSLGLDRYIIIDGLSRDGTLEYLRTLDVEVHHKKFKPFNMRNEYLKLLEDGDFVIYQDPDEFLFRKDVDKMVELSDRFDALLMRKYFFYHDWYHIMIGKADLTYVNQRGFRFFEGCRFSKTFAEHKLYTPNDELYLAKHPSVLLSGRVFNYRFALGAKHYTHSRKKEGFQINRKKDLWFHPNWYILPNIKPNLVKKIELEHPDLMKKHEMYNRHIIKDV